MLALIDLNLTVEQILGLAPNPNLMRTTRAIAAPEKWGNVSRNDAVAWGSFAIINRKPFQTAIHLTTFTATCTCTTRQSPCNHALALLLLAHNGQIPISATPTPEWAIGVNQHGLTIYPADFGRNPLSTQAKRLRAARRGLADLEQWLHDMIRAGFAQLPNRSKAYWATMAARLIDTHCPKLAQAVRRWQTLLDTEPNWAEQLLRQLGSVQLLIDAFKRFESFSAEIQNDLCHAVGLSVDPHPNDPLISDRWHVIGSHVERHGRRRFQQTWLYGTASQQYAQLITPAATRQQPRQQLIVGTQFDAALRFLASSHPVRVMFASVPEKIGMIDTQPIPTRTILDLNAHFSQLRTQNFWLDAVPATLQSVSAQCSEGRWIIIDRDGYQLPLPPDFKHGWHLMAMVNTPLFGVWDGNYFRPMSLWHADQWVELRLLAEAGK